jgi:hypothetical protein
MSVLQDDPEQNRSIARFGAPGICSRFGTAEAVAGADGGQCCFKAVAEEGR